VEKGIGDLQHLFNEIPTGLNNSLNPRPELLAGAYGWITTSLSLSAITSEIWALREALGCFKAVY
jgi:hypothetical protein